MIVGTSTCEVGVVYVGITSHLHTNRIVCKTNLGPISKCCQADIITKQFAYQALMVTSQIIIQDIYTLAGCLLYVCLAKCSA